MIGLRDRYSTRLRGEAWLLFGDGLAAGSAILLASGATAAGHGFTDRAWIVLWAILPRALGRALDPILRQPRGILRNVAVAASVGATLVALIAIGLTLLEGSATDGLARSARSWWLLVIIFAWGVGFLLFLPRVYLIHDLFLGGLVVLSLAIRRDESEALVPIFLLGLGISGAIRHQLYDVFSEIRQPRVNLHNARRLALALGVVGSAVFLLVHLGANELFPRIGLVPPPPVVIPGSRLADRGSGGGSGELFRPGDSRFRPAARSDGGDPTDATIEIPSNARIGFSRTIQLGALSRPQSDPRVVLRVREFAVGVITPSPQPTLRPNALWRGLTLSTFDGLGERWEEEVLVSGTFRNPESALAYDPGTWGGGSGPDRSLHVTVVTPVMPTLPVPYFPRFVRLPLGTTTEYQQNAAGDIFSVGGVPEGVEYAIRISPHPQGRPAWPTEPVTGQHTDPRYLQIPDPDDLGFDLTAHARPIFFGARSVQERIDRLQAHFAEGFRYDIEAYWVPVTGRLREFCLREKVGNCEYFATAAAMLLRAGGVSTRVVAGFLGWEWHPEERAYWIRNGSAHLWTEVYFPGHGWFPLDATGWVPGFDPSGWDAEPQPTDPALALGANEPDRPDGPQGSDGGAARPGATREQPSTVREVAAPDREGALSERAREGEAAVTRREEPESASWIEIGRPPDDVRRRGRTREEDRRDRLRRERAVGAERGISEREDRVKVVSRAARLGLLAIALAIGGAVLVGFVRPPRREEEPDSDPHRPRGGIPDPLAGLDPLPEDFSPTNLRERILYGYHRLQRDLADRRRHRRRSETPLEHGTRLAKRIPAIDDDATRLHAIVYAALYGRADCTPSDAEEVERLCDRLRHRLR